MFPLVPWMIVGMEPEALERLGQFVVARRKEQGWATREQFASNVDLTYRVLTDLENGKRQLGAKAYASIESALDWVHGSVDSVLGGGHPKAQNVLVSSADLERARAIAEEIVNAPPTPHDVHFSRAERLLAHAHRSVQQGDYLGAIHGLEGVESTVELLIDRITDSATEQPLEGDQHEPAHPPATQPGASGEARQKQEGQTADDLAKRRPPPADLDDTPPSIDLADAARIEPGHVKQGDRVKHNDEVDQVDDEAGEESQDDDSGDL